MYDSLPLSHVRVWLKPFKSTEPLGQLSQLKKNWKFKAVIHTAVLKKCMFFCLTNQLLNLFYVACARSKELPCNRSEINQFNRFLHDNLRETG